MEQAVAMQTGAGTSSMQSASEFCTQLRRVPQFSQYDLSGFLSACDATLTRVVAKDRYAARLLGPHYPLYSELAGDLTAKGLNLKSLAHGPMRHPHKMKFLIDQLMQDESKKTYCEVGFGAGERSIMMLGTRSDVAVHSFEATEDPTTIPAHDYIDARYTDRLTLYLGDPSITVPRLIAVQPDMTCDIMHIDGSQPEHIIRAALLDFMELATPSGHVLLLDVPEEQGLADVASGALEDSVKRGDFLIAEVASDQFGALSDEIIDGGLFAGTTVLGYFNNIRTGQAEIAPGPN